MCLRYLAFVARVRKFLQRDLIDSFHEPVGQALLQTSVKFNLHVIYDKSVCQMYNKGGIVLCLSDVEKEAWPLYLSL